MARSLILLLSLVLSSCFPESFAVNDSGPADVGMDTDRADAQPEDAPADVSLTLDGGPVDAPLDAAPPNNISVACPMQWTELSLDTPPPCAGRRIDVVGSGLAPNDADIALLANQEVALAWNDNTLVDSGRMELRVLDAESLAVTRTARIEPEGAIGEVVGTSISIVADDDDVHLAYWLRSDSGSSIKYRRWFETGILSEAETISTQVDLTGNVSLGVSRGDATFAFHDQVTGLHFARTRRRGGELEDSVRLGEDRAMVAIDSPAVALALVDGTAHLAYRQREFSDRASSLYRRRIENAGWGSPAYLDGRINSRYSGIAIDIAVFGDRVAVAYLDWSDGTTELRLVTWSTTPDDLEVRVVASYSSEEAPVYTPLDVEFDSFGLLHILFADDSGNRLLQYWREPVIGSGWVRDTIIELTPEADILARMVIGPARRPHIVFAARGDIHYATITP